MPGQTDNTIVARINNSLHAAYGAFGGFWKHISSKHGIAVSMKCKLYKGIVFPTVLY